MPGHTDTRVFLKAIDIVEAIYNRGFKITQIRYLLSRIILCSPIIQDMVEGSEDIQENFTECETLLELLIEGMGDFEYSDYGGCNTQFRLISSENVEAPALTK